jgi:hypothetical protein
MKSIFNLLRFQTSAGHGHVIDRVVSGMITLAHNCDKLFIRMTITAFYAVMQCIVASNVWEKRDASIFMKIKPSCSSETSLPIFQPHVA